MVPSLHERALHALDASLDASWRKKFYTQNEYFGISNCIFNFNFLAVVVSEILGGPKITLG